MLINDITGAVGNTPLLRLDRFCTASHIEPCIFAKLEMFNPYSVKDRVALSMIDGAGNIASVVEATSGNTGIGLCMVCAARGIPITVVMPENASDERKAIVRAFGANLVLTPAKDGMMGANARARQIRDDTGAFLCSQFDNPLNVAAHEATAREIYNDLGGNVDIFVAAVGTGGTFTGVARFLKSRVSRVRAYAVEPAGSPVLSGGAPGSHRIPGIGAGFVPANFDRDVCDGIFRVSDSDAESAAMLLAKSEGVLSGLSGGAALAAAVGIAQKESGRRIVVVLPDSLERYLSMIK